MNINFDDIDIEEENDDRYEILILKNNFFGEDYLCSILHDKESKDYYLILSINERVGNFLSNVKDIYINGNLLYVMIYNENIDVFKNLNNKEIERVLNNEYEITNDYGEKSTIYRKFYYKDLYKITDNIKFNN